MYEDGYKVGIIDKTYPYGTMPEEKDIEEVLKESARKIANLAQPSSIDYDFE